MPGLINNPNDNKQCKVLSPFILWSQTESDVCLRIIIRINREPDIELKEKSIEFKALGTGSTDGKNEYYFKFDFFDKMTGNVQVIKKESELVLMISKKELEWWPRLTHDVRKPPFLKLDFDRLQNSDDEDDLQEDTLSNYSNIHKRTEGAMSQIRKRKRVYQKRVENFRKVYLFLFNMFQLIGFLYILIVLTLSYAKEGPAFMEKAYPLIQTAFTFSQCFQILEVLHPLLGYTSGSALTPFLQVFGRFTMLFAMINGEPRIQSKPVVFYLIYVYTLSEVIRYPYYMLRVYDINVGLLTWLRYTVWIALYPLGFLCEGIIILRNIPYFEETKSFSIFLPNKWNFSFYFPTVMRVYLLLGLFPFLYFMMTYMYRQRKKILHHKKD